MSGNLVAYAIPTAPLIDQRGMLTAAWYRFFVSLIQRTGGTGGKVTPDSVPAQLTFLDFGNESIETEASAWWPETVIETAATLALQPDVNTCWSAPFWPTNSAGAAPPVVSITPGASPFTYEAPAPGFVLVSGGTVSSITWTRDGSTLLATDMLAGFFPCEAGDAIVVTYTVAPTMNFLGSVV